MSFLTSFKHNDSIQFMHNYMLSHGSFNDGSVLLNLIVEKCDEDPELAKAFDQWVSVPPASEVNKCNKKYSTVFFRDNIAIPFQDKYEADIDFFNAWVAIDTAQHELELDEHAKTENSLEKFAETYKKASPGFSP